MLGYQHFSFITFSLYLAPEGKSCLQEPRDMWKAITKINERGKKSTGLSFSQNFIAKVLCFMRWKKKPLFLSSSSITYWKMKTWLNDSFNVTSSFIKSWRKTFACRLCRTVCSVEPKVKNQSSISGTNQISKVGNLLCSLLAVGFISFLFQRLKVL